MQRHPTRHHDLQLRAGTEQLCHLQSGIHHLLKVVQQEQQVLLSQRRFQELEEGLSSDLFDLECLSDGRDDELNIAQERQVDEEDAINESVAQLSGHLQTQAGLAGAARAGQCHEAHVLAAQQISNGRYLVLTSKKWRRLDRQVIREALQGVQWWE